MAKRIVIVGGLPSQPERNEFLEQLRARHALVEWDWLQTVTPAFNLLPRPFSALLHELTKGDPLDPHYPIVVKLFHLHGREAHALHRVYRDPVLPPREIATGDEFLEWLLSPAAGLVGTIIWEGTIRQTALVAILAKLLRNKSFNKDSQGHNWTKESDLLGQAPVNRPQYPNVYSLANSVLERANGNLLLTKGSGQGKTPKEWCINTKHLGAVKRMLVQRTFDPLRGEAACATLLDFVARDIEGRIEIDDGILSEVVLATCRGR